MHLPAGTYYLGDPCYVIPDAFWDSLSLPEDDTSQMYTVHGRLAWRAFTHRGDGTYADGAGTTYSVDSGMLGATPVDPGYEGQLPSPYSGGQVRTFPAPFVVAWDAGVFRMGAVVIDIHHGALWQPQ